MKIDKDAPLAALNVSVQIGSARILDGVSGAFQRGETTGILGANGAGKTTLLRALAGAQPLAGGSVLLEGRPIEQYSKRERAQILGVMAQHTEGVAELTPRDIVSMGRFAHRSVFASMSRRDVEAVDAALEAAELSELQHRPSSELSGGERQRMFLAQIWAQEPSVVLLDEPTAHLDIKYQMETMQAARALADERGWTVAAALHDLNLAYRYCDKLMFLREGKALAFGRVDELRDPRLIQETYGVQARFVEADGVWQAALSV